jgi:putative oxidoreductase
MKLPFLLGRIIYGGFFLYSGINNFKELKKLSQYTASKDVPFPEVAVGASGALLVFGGMSILLGVKPKLGSAALLAFLAGASPTMHDFWNAADPQQRQNEMINFMKNLALAGSALALMGIEEPWPSSMPVPRIAA